MKYIETLQDKSGARKLLASERGDVLSHALVALVGTPVDAELLTRLKELLRAERYFLRFNAARVMAADPSEAYVREKTSAIIEAIQRVEQRPDAGHRFPGFLAYGTIADHAYFRYIDALAKMKGAALYLRQASRRVGGKACWCVLMARARRGDASVKKRMYAIIKDPSAGLLRAAAVRSLKRISTPEDLPFLKNLAETDSLQVPAPKGCHPDPATGRRVEKIYPVRIEAELAVRYIEKKRSNENK